MNNKLSITDLADQLFDSSDISKKEAIAFAKALFEIIEENLINDKIVKLKSFGTFKLIWVESRRIANVNTGEIQEIPGHYKTTFTPDAELSDTVNEPFAHLETIILDDEIIADEPIYENPLSTEEKEAIIETDNNTIREITPKLTLTPQESEKKETESTLLNPANVESTTILVNQPSVLNELTVNTDIPSLIVSPIKTVTSMKNEDEDPDLDNEIEEDEEYEKSDRAVIRWIIVVLILVLIAFAAYFLYFNSKGHKLNLSQNIPTYEELAKKDSADKAISSSDTSTAEVAMETPQKANQQVAKQQQNAAQVINRADQQKALASSTPKTDVKPAQNEAPASLSSKKEQKTASNIADKQTTEKITGEKANKLTVKADTETKPSKSGKKIATEVMKSGSRLTLMAQKYYGNKAFWVYIYQANKAKINNPNNVPVGTEVIIPAKETYSIDPNNKESVDRAKNMAKSILK